MNLIEQLGGYEATKEKYQDLSDSDMITIGPVEFSAKDYFEDELLEYRRQHNIFEVGDKVIGSKLFDDRIFEFQYYLPELSMAVISKDGAAIGLNQLRHATDEEIKAGKRLEVNTIDSNIDKQVNLMDQFIADGGFDKAFVDVFGLPESVKQSLKEIS